MAAAEEPLDGGGSTRVHRCGDVVLRERRPWSTVVIRLLEHLIDAGIDFAPRPVDGGFAADGRERLEYIEAEPAPPVWSVAAAFGVGAMLQAVHAATATFPLADGWMPWWGRRLPSADVVIGHCDAAPWNFLAADGLPVALLDWDTVGPVGREWDVAQTAWLNAQLHDDDVAERQQLPEAETRAGMLAAFCEGYGLTRMQRARLVDDMIAVAVRTAAQEAIDSGVTEEGTAPTAVSGLGGGPAFDGHELLWAVTWRVRSARWMLDHRDLLTGSLR